MRHALLLAATACMLSACPAFADPFDGAWQVTIITKKGGCDQAYSYPVSVKDGDVDYAGQGGFDIDGKVQDSGAVQVRIALGSRAATGTGRLVGKSGSGTWQDGTNACSGVWRASRKS